MRTLPVGVTSRTDAEGTSGTGLPRRAAAQEPPSARHLEGMQIRVESWPQNAPSPHSLSSEQIIVQKLANSPCTKSPKHRLAPLLPRHCPPDGEQNLPTPTLFPGSP